MRWTDGRHAVPRGLAAAALACASSAWAQPAPGERRQPFESIPKLTVRG